MKLFPKPGLLGLWLLLAVGWAGCSSAGGPGGHERSQKKEAQRPAGVAWQVASMLNGTYRGEGEISGLRLDISSAQEDLPSPSLFNLFARLTGKYGKRNFNEAGVIQVEPHVDRVLVAVVPHFDPSVSLLSDEATAFSPTEINAACHLVFLPLDEGYAGRTQGSGTCVRALGGAVGEWVVQILPGEIRLSQPNSSEALVFRKTGRG
jgi:hypothetical protein